MDELAGAQAWERKHPDLPMAPTHVLRREFEYIRHGTLSWFLNFEVVSGQVIEPSWAGGRHALLDEITTRLIQPYNLLPLNRTYIGFICRYYSVDEVVYV